MALLQGTLSRGSRSPRVPLILTPRIDILRYLEDPELIMGIAVYSLLRVMQDLYHQPCVWGGFLGTYDVLLRVEGLGFTWTPIKPTLFGFLSMISVYKSLFFRVEVVTMSFSFRVDCSICS